MSGLKTTELKVGDYVEWSVGFRDTDIGKVIAVDDKRVVIASTWLQGKIEYRHDKPDSEFYITSRCIEQCDRVAHHILTRS